MKRITMLAAVVIALAVPIAHAQTADHMQHGAASTPGTAPMTAGEVIKVDKDLAKITIKHGPLLNLKMPGMTMAFKVKDPAMLEQVEAGDKVSFSVEKLNGSPTITVLKGAIQAQER